MRILLARKLKNGINLYKNGFGDDFIYCSGVEDINIVEKNGLFVLFHRVKVSEEQIIDIRNNEEDIMNSLANWCKKNKYESELVYIDYPVLKFNELFKRTNQDLMLINDIEKIKEFNKKLPKIKEELEKKLMEFRDGYIYPLYNEYKSRSRTSKKKIEAMENLISMNIESCFKYVETNDFHYRDYIDNLLKISNEIIKEEDMLLFINTYILKGFKEFVEGKGTYYNIKEEQEKVFWNVFQ